MAGRCVVVRASRLHVLRCRRNACATREVDFLCRPRSSNVSPISPKAAIGPRSRPLPTRLKPSPGVKLLDVDPGADTNRTVVTFVGSPEAVAEAAFQAIAKAAQVIDMRGHHGSHPRMGATDVCPFVPVEGVTLEDCAEIAHRVGRRVGEELGISVYFYEAAARDPRRRNLADVRRGEYEGLAAKLKDPAWKPDCGPADVQSPKRRHDHRRPRVPDRLQRHAQHAKTRRPPRTSPSSCARRAASPGPPTASPYYPQGRNPLLPARTTFPAATATFVGKTLARNRAALPRSPRLRPPRAGRWRPSPIIPTSSAKRSAGRASSSSARPSAGTPTPTAGRKSPSI